MFKRQKKIRKINAAGSASAVARHFQYRALWENRKSVLQLAGELAIWDLAAGQDSRGAKIWTNIHEDITKKTRKPRRKHEEITKKSRIIIRGMLGVAAMPRKTYA